MPEPSSSPTPPPHPYLQPAGPGNGLPADSEPPLTPWIEALLLCVISARFYVEVIRRWRGLGFIFLAMVLMLVSIPCAMKLHVIMAEELRTMNEIVVPQMPRIEIKNGQASTNVPQPHIIREDPKNPNSAAWALIDTNLEKIDLTSRQEYVVVIRNDIYMKAGPETGQYIRVQMGPDEVLEPNMIKVFCTIMSHISGWIFYPILVFRNFLIWSLHALLLAGLSSLMLMGRRIGAKFPDLLRMCIVACTPAIYLETIAFLAEVRWDLWSMVLAIVAVMYVTSALRAAADDMLEPSEPSRS